MLYEVITLGIEPGQGRLADAARSGQNIQVFGLDTDMKIDQVILIEAVARCLGKGKPPVQKILFSNLFGQIFKSRITSYNVCYTKLLRVNSIAETEPEKRNKRRQRVIFQSELLHEFLTRNNFV